MVGGGLRVKGLKVLISGGKSTGAKTPRVKHGYYTKAAIEERKWLNQLLKDANKLASEISA